MKKSLFAFASAIAILACGSVSAQTISNGPYYATPSWDQQLPTAQRFIVLQNWNNEAFLDRETGLVWERQPVNNTFNWLDAMVNCRSHLIGNRRGWRLPSYEELTSLIDGTQNPIIPVAQQVFLGNPGDRYWTATQVENDSTGASAYTVTFGVAVDFEASQKIANVHIWCVRGGSATTNPP
jgi:hypothetical protein